MIQQTFTQTTAAANGGTSCTALYGGEDGATRWSSTSCSTAACTAAAPTNNLTVVNNTRSNGTAQSITQAVGESKTVTWSSTNALPSNAGSTYVISDDGSHTCTKVSTNGSWDANFTTSGSITNVGTQDNVGCIHTITYTVTDASGQRPAVATISVHTIAAQPPTATLTVDGVDNETISVGQNNTKTWSSTNGVAFSSVYIISDSGANTCTRVGATGTWSANNTASGTITNTGTQDNVGCTHRITYTVTNASGQTADAIIWLTTIAAPGTSPTGTPIVSLTVNGADYATVHVGEIKTTSWSSTGGTSWGSTFVVVDAPGATCSNKGSGTWNAANTASGSIVNSGTQENVGCLQTNTYTVTNSTGSATDAIYITTVPALPSASLEVNGVHEITVAVGESKTTVWDSNGGTAWNATYEMTGSCTNTGARSGVWNSIYTESGAITNAGAPENVGCTHTITYTVTNASGNASDTIIVHTVAAVGSAFGSITSNSCAIGTGSSSCAMNVEWSSFGTVGAVTVQRPYDGGSIFSSGANGNTPATFTPPATYTLDLYDGITKLASGTFTATCASGSSWDVASGTCLVVPANPCSAALIDNCSLSATGSGGSSGSCGSESCNYSCNNGAWSINSNSCTASTCTTPWGQTIADGVSVQAFSVPSVVAPSSCPASQTRTCTAGFLSGSYTNSSCTVLTPTLSISANPARVHTGGTTIISWSASGGVTSCTVAKNGTPAWRSGLASPNGGVSDTITSQSVYTISCNIGSPQSVTANVLPAFQEF